MDANLPGASPRLVLEGRRHMSKIWYCPNCGYEVGARGRCHQCRQRLVASSLPELVTADEDDEVGYRLDDWTDRERGRLIESLNQIEILHRFEDDELVVAAEDESRVDDLIAEVAASPDDRALDDGSMLGGAYEGDATIEGGPLTPEEEEQVGAAVRLLADAARRLREDPTDMHADADVAEASATVFTVESFSVADEETWAAVGRVTRRLLSALGADEALDDEIRTEAAILDKLLAPLAEPEPEPVAPDSEVATASSSPELDGDETVYELPEWLPEQRAKLGLLLDEADVRYQWDEDDLVVPSDREADVESLFEQVDAPSGGDDEDDDDGESRYRTLEELFAAADRLAGDPADEQRGADTMVRIQEAAGPPPIGLDEVQWFRIMTQARTLSDSIEAGCEAHVIAQEAIALRDLLRAVV
jgi:hypothetical protein